MAVEDGVLVGTVTDPPPGSRYREIGGDDEGEFRMLAVAPSAQGRGVGQALVEFLLDRYRERGYRGVVISTLAEMTAAHRVYERLGFRRAPELDWSPLPGRLAHRLPARPGRPGGRMSELSATLRFTVTDADTASALGSGDLPVLGTPRLLAWCEAATCAAIAPALPPGGTSVGTRVELEHQAASAVGREVEVSAAASYVDGRLHRFTVAARHVVGRRARRGRRHRRGHPGGRRRRAVPRAASEAGWLAASWWPTAPPERIGGAFEPEVTMSKTGRKRRARKKKAANHGKRPNA